MKYQAGVPGPSTVPPGKYPFECTNAEEKESSSGNPMIELTHKIKGGPTVYDYLVGTDGGSWKIDQFRAATGEQVRPGMTDLEADSCIGRTGECILYEDEYQGQKKNKVAEYVVVARPPANSGNPKPKDDWRK